MAKQHGVQAGAGIAKPMAALHQGGAVIGTHEAFSNVLRLVDIVAQSNSTTLLLGETGTGKEVVARAIHAKSFRKDGPFVAVNCAAIPEHLLESELFGHERGAFTGAVARRTGLFERASSGTLFLDEVADLPLPLQPKLLRAIQEREITLVGGSASRSVDVRIVAATNHDLADRVGGKAFREDLYYRLNVFPIRLPALRDRPTDIPQLACFFLERLAADAGKVKHLSPQAQDCLRQYSWPGNVRELQAVIERAWLMAASDEIGVTDLTEVIRDPPWRERRKRVEFWIPEKGFALEEFESSLIEQAMARSNGVVAAAARMLGLSYRTLQYRLQRVRGQRKTGDLPTTPKRQ